MKYLFILLIFSIAGISTASSQVKTEPALQVILDNFFNKYHNNSPSEAIDYIFGTNKSFTSEQTLELKQKLTSTKETIGSDNGNELITSKSTTPSLVFFSYLVKHQKQPLRFTFIFYKPNDQWMLYKFKYDDQVGEELEEAGRIYFIR